MAFAFGSTVLEWNHKTASLSATSSGTPSPIINPDELLIYIVATDNVQTTDGNTTLHSSLTLTASGKSTTTFTKAREFTNGQAAAAAGATISIWYAISADTYDTATTHTFNISGATNVTAKALGLYRFTKASGSTLNLAGGADLAADAVAHGAINISGLTSREYLFVQAWADESVLAATPSVTNGTAFGVSFGTSGGSATTNITADGGYRIFTGTANSMTVALSNVDAAGTYIALNEVIAPVTIIPDTLMSTYPAR